VLKERDCMVNVVCHVCEASFRHRAVDSRLVEIDVGKARSEFEKQDMSFVTSAVCEEDS
jgi:hypothetical protein